MEVLRITSAPKRNWLHILVLRIYSQCICGASMTGVNLAIAPFTC